MNATISNKQHPDWGCATIPLPIPDEEYARCMEMLEQLEIGGVTARDCHIDRLDRSLAVLDVLEGQEVNIDELDFLARSIDRYWGNEQDKFEGMAYKLGIKDIQGFINLSFGCEQATVITNFEDLSAAGKDHYMDTHGGSAPVGVLESLDGEKLIRDLIATGAGTVTPNGVIFDNGLRIEQEYTGQNFPVYYDKAYLMELELAPLESEDTPLTLLLPTPEKRLERLLERGGYQSAKDIQITIWRSELPDPINDRLNMAREGLIELNRMFQAVEKLKGPGMDRLTAAVLMAQPEYASQVRHLAENLDRFDFVPGVASPEAYAKFMIKESGHYEYDENLDAFYDVRRYGELRVAEEGGQFTNLGYVCYKGALSLDELMMEDPAEQEQQLEQGQMMGGMM